MLKRGPETGSAIYYSITNTVMLKKSFSEVLRCPKLKVLPSDPMYLALGSKYE